MRAAPLASKCVSFPEVFSVIMAGSYAREPPGPGHRMSSFLPAGHPDRVKARALITAVLLACNGPLGHAQGLPDLGDISSVSLSDTQETTIGNRIMREIRIDKDFIEDPEVYDYINSLGNRLLAGADGPHRDIDFFVVRDDAINAFALVGGHIGVHSALVLLTQNESSSAK